MFERLFDLCEAVGLECYIRVYKHATKTVPATLGIVVKNKKKKVSDYKMGAPDDPPLDDLAGFVINDLESKGYLDPAPSS